MEETPILQMEDLRVKGMVVYDTSYGNTQKIAETITETLKESGIEVDLFDVKNVKKLSGKNYSFLVLGSWFSNQIWHNELCNKILFGQGEE